MNQISRKWQLPLIVGSLITVLLLFAAIEPGQAENVGTDAAQALTDALDVSFYTGSADPTNYGTRDCRYGLVDGLTNNDFSTTGAWMDTFNAGWQLDFRHDGESTPARESVSMVRVKQVLEDGSRPANTYTTWPKTSVYQAFASQNKGRLWVIGNEPDHPIYQDSTEPALYARAFHEIRQQILSADPTARFGNAGMVQVTPNRIQYLDKVWNAYNALYGEPMPVDVWTIHAYIVQETEMNSEGVLVQAGGAGSALGSTLASGMKRPEYEPPQMFDYMGNADKSRFFEDYNNGLQRPPYIAADDLAEYKADLAASQASLNCNSGDPESDYYNHVGAAAVDDGYYCIAEHDDLRIFKQQIELMRQWMKNNGQKEKPLIITEMGSLWAHIQETNAFSGEPQCFVRDEFGECFTEERVSRYMEGVFDYLESATDATLGYSKDGDHLVQQWAWYSLFQFTADTEDPAQNAAIGASSNLINDPNNYLPGHEAAFTEVGNMYQAYATAAITSSILSSDLIVDIQPSAVAITSTGATEYPIAIQIKVRNVGNTATDQPTIVAFYADAARTQPVAAVTLPTGISGCAVGTYELLVTGTIDPTVTAFYAELDINDALNETASGQSNNVYADAAGDPLAIPIEFVEGKYVYMPILTR